MSLTELPAYKNPPAVETLMGVYFARLAEWNLLRFGQFWSELQSDYPHGQILPPIIEPLRPEMVSELPVRATFINREKTELVQVQDSCFFRNWRKTEENKSYTHYEQLRPRYLHEWDRFKDFLAKKGIKAPQVYQCEVTYVNHLIRGVEWNSYLDIAKVFKPIAPRTIDAHRGRQYEFLPEAASFGFNGGYNLAELGVTLQMQANSAVRQPDGSEVIQLTISAKGDTPTSDDSVLTETLDRCHRAVILGFSDITTEEAQQMWGRER